MKIYGDVDIRGKSWPQIAIDYTEEDFTEDIDSGRILFNAGDNCLYFGAKNEWVKITDTNDLINAGQRLIFCNEILPTGYTLVDIDDKTIIITNSLSSVGLESGSWIISDTEYSANHNHYSSSGMGYASRTIGRGTSEIHAVAGGRYHKHTLSSAGRHKHTFQGTWRPAYMKYILGEYEG